MGEVIDLFPKRTVQVEMVEPPEMCEGVLHIFDAVPGRCRCGEEYWTPQGELAPPTEAIGVHEVRLEVTG